MIYRSDATAFNTHPDSHNPIHSEEARSLGFDGGIVPGVTLYGYLVTLLVEAWGEGWLEGGSISIRFTKPVYDGDDITCLLDTGLDPDVGLVTILNKSRQTVVAGIARQHVAARTPKMEDFPIRQRPERRELAAVPTLGKSLPLVEEVIETGEQDQSRWLERAGNLRPPFDRLIHPVVMARVTSDLVDEIYEVRGGRVLKSLATTLCGTRELGSEIRARGVIRRAWTERGRDHMAVEMLLCDDADRAVMHVSTESIFNLGVEEQSG